MGKGTSGPALTIGRDSFRRKGQIDSCNTRERTQTQLVHGKGTWVKPVEGIEKAETLAWTYEVSGGTLPKRGEEEQTL